MTQFISQLRGLAEHRYAGSQRPMNLASFDLRWSDTGQGCWTCLDARKWIAIAMKDPAVTPVSHPAEPTETTGER